jgi:hypothetical protein
MSSYTFTHIHVPSPQKRVLLQNALERQNLRQKHQQMYEIVNLDL